jgi:hypothetical protein
MLYLRNTNQQQSLGRDIKRGITNVCCTPTLNSVTTASLTQLTIDGTFGTYLVNCKSCVGGYIEVSENSGSTWSIINPGNCSETNLVPQPSQSAYYRLFTSCSSVDQPFDPLVSDYSNEIFFVPYGIVNYKFVEEGIGANGVFRLNQNATQLVNATSSVSGTFWEIPSASFMTASLFATEFPLTGSTSMSLTVTGSGESFTTSSCLQSGAIFLDSWKVTPHLFYDVTASISHRPENSCSTSGSYVDMGYLVNSYDQSTGIWYRANQYGVYDPTNTQYPSASVTGSATKTNIVSGDCRQNAIQFSGSLTLPVDPGSSGFPLRKVYMNIVTGSFTLSGNSWSMTNRYTNTGSVDLFNYHMDNITNKNGDVGFQVESFVGPFGARTISLVITGSTVASNPPIWPSGPSSLGSSITLTGEGIIRAFGYGYFGSSEGLGNQNMFNCIYDTTPSK